MSLLEKLEAYRLDNRLSQEKLAKKLKVSFCTVNRWLTGKTKPNKIQAYHIVKLLQKKI
jgi:transcriptional regulator with XRE-family HTH domain